MTHMAGCADVSFFRNLVVLRICVHCFVIRQHCDLIIGVQSSIDVAVADAFPADRPSWILTNMILEMSQYPLGRLARTLRWTALLVVSTSRCPIDTRPFCGPTALAVRA